MDFEELDTFKVFKKAIKNVSKDYFYDELREASKITQMNFVDYLELLSYLQKSQDKNTDLLKEKFFSKAKAMNKIILYRYYELLYFSTSKIISSGKNCIFAENIFNDPYPLRKDIFFAFFKIFRDRFKIVNIYTDIRAVVKQNAIYNDKIIDRIFKKKLNVREIESSYDLLQHPLFALEQFPLFFRVTKDIKYKKDAFEFMSGYDLKEAYLESIQQTKKIFGFIVSFQYPYFYHKQSILNEIGKDFLYIKNFSNTDLIYISNHRIDYDYSIIEANHTEQHQICSDTFLSNLKCWIDQEDYKPYIESRKLHTNSQHKAHKQLSPPSKTILTKTMKHSIKLLLNKDNLVLFLEDIVFQAEDSDKKLQLIINKLEVNNPLYLFLYLENKVWAAYLIHISLDKTLNIMHYNNSNTELCKQEKHLILINNLYKMIATKLNFHFFTHCVNLNNNTSVENAESRDILNLCLNILNNNQ